MPNFERQFVMCKSMLRIALHYRPLLLVTAIIFTVPFAAQAATSIDEKLFLSKLLKHVAPHVCSVKDPYGEGGDNAAKPTKVDFRDTSFRWENKGTGRMSVSTLAKFYFPGGHEAIHQVAVSIQPKGGMFAPKGSWYFAGDLDYDLSIGNNLGGKGASCYWFTGIRATHRKIPPLEFNVGYKE